MTRVAIISAMVGELKPLVRGWQHDRRNGVDLWRWRFDEGEWVAACAGAGVDAATRALAEVEKDGRVDSVVSTGWAGALSAEFAPGRTYSVAGVVDARTGERFAAETFADSVNESLRERDMGHPGLWLVTNARVADEVEKQRLAATYMAGLVDMEAAGIARIAQMRGIPFYCVKGVSDGYREQLPDFNRFISSGGQFKLAGFIVFAILRPWYWRVLMRMSENGNKAACGIAESLLDILDKQGEIRKRNGYPSFKR